MEDRLCTFPHLSPSSIQGDFTDADSIRAVIKDCHRAFLVSSAGEDSQFDVETSFLQIAKEANVEAVVRISTAAVLISLDSTGVYAKAHARIEKHIAEHKLPVIDLQPNWFMSNWLSSAGEIKATGKITFPVDSTSSAFKFAMVDPRDVAGAAAALLTLPLDKLQPFLASGYVEVHGPEEISFNDQARAIGEVISKDVTINYIDPDAWQKVLESYGMTEYFARSFKETVLHVAGKIPPKRPLLSKSSPLLLEVWQPQYNVKAWAEANKAAFV